MKKLIGLFLIISSLILSGCFDTIEETTFNDDGSGIYASTADMGKIFSAINGLGGALGADNEKMKDLEKLVADTTMRLTDMADSTIKFTTEERELIEKGTARLIINY